MVKLGTHSGKFHVDEVLSTLILRKIYPSSTLIRTRDISKLDECDIVYDVGAVYDPKRKRFDHHQQTFNETFSNEYKIKLSSAGLIYKHFTNELFTAYGYKKDEYFEILVKKMYEDYFLGIDANDNGVEHGGIYKTRNIASIVSSIYKNGDENREFESAVNLVKLDFDNYMDYLLNDWILMYKKAKVLVEKCNSGIVVSDEYVSTECLRLHGDYFKKDIKFLVFKGNISYRICGIPIKKGSFLRKVTLLDSWCGLKDDELVKESKIKTATFVHVSGFTGGALELHDAIKMCEISIDALR